MKTLIVDDSTTMRRIITGALAETELNDVIHAGDGLEAVNKVTHENIGLILMDWNMPNMTGIDAVRMIRSLGHKMPIIMVTTEGEKERVLEAIKAGANNYIIKPFQPQALVAKVMETLTRAAAKV